MVLPALTTMPAPVPIFVKLETVSVELLSHALLWTNAISLEFVIQWLDAVILLNLTTLHAVMEIFALKPILVSVELVEEATL